jgi:hypothetical protein
VTINLVFEVYYIVTQSIGSAGVEKSEPLAFKKKISPPFMIWINYKAIYIGRFIDGNSKNTPRISRSFQFNIFLIIKRDYSTGCKRRSSLKHAKYDFLYCDELFVNR